MESHEVWTLFCGHTLVYVEKFGERESKYKREEENWGIKELEFGKSGWHVSYNLYFFF